jgi:hypothetical protein
MADAFEAEQPIAAGILRPTHALRLILILTNQLGDEQTLHPCVQAAKRMP